MDGSGLKNTLERRAIETLAAEDPEMFRNKNVLLTCAVDRFGMAQALQHTGSNVLYGDVMFALGIPFPIYKLNVLRAVVGILAPVAVQFPFKWLYPIGSKQEESQIAQYAKYYAWADVIAVITHDSEIHAR